MTSARLKHYGWGREGEGMSAEERTFVLGRYRAKFATDEFDTIVVPGLEDLSLREPRVLPPASLADFCTTERYDRAAHTYGKSYPDYVGPCSAITTVHPTLWPIRVTRRRFPP